MSILAKRRGLVIPALCTQIQLVQSTTTDTTYYLPDQDGTLFSQAFGFTLTQENGCTDVFDYHDMNDVFKNEIKTWLVDATNGIYYTQFGADVQDLGYTGRDSSATDWTGEPKYYDDSCEGDGSFGSRRILPSTDRTLCQYDPCSDAMPFASVLSTIDLNQPMGSSIEIEEAKYAITGINFKKADGTSRGISRTSSSPKLCAYEEEKAHDLKTHNVSI